MDLKKGAGYQAWYSISPHISNSGQSANRTSSQEYMITVRKRSYLRRFSDCEFAQFVRICCSANERCGHHSAAFEVFCWITCVGRDMGTDTIFDILIGNVQRETFNSRLSMR